MLAYVDDIMVFGPFQRHEDFINGLHDDLVVKEIGGLNHDIERISFSGGQMTRDGEAVRFESLEEYLADIGECLGLQKGCSAATTGRHLVRNLDKSEEPLDAETRKQYPSLVGKLAGASLIRPELSYATKEVARGLAFPNSRR